MKQIFAYIRSYINTLNPFVFFLTSAVVAALIILNYTRGVETLIFSAPSFGIKFLDFYLLYTFVFCLAWLIIFILTKEKIPVDYRFYILLVIAPAIFAFKMSFDGLTILLTKDFSYPWNQYWYLILNWPIKCMLTILLIVMAWRWLRFEKPIAGLAVKKFDIKPYLLLLLCMLPLLALASMRQDFLLTYPKVKAIAFLWPWVREGFFWRLLYEISYGIDFITIETFFRGFLVLAFVRFAGKDAILPMAAFYCSIHFGKPLFECITSYFGGIILGIIVYNTRSIWGGYILHVGIAWLMELVGYISHQLMY